jgi:hypothetical protein
MGRVSNGAFQTTYWLNHSETFFLKTSDSFVKILIRILLHLMVVLTDFQNTHFVHEKGIKIKMGIVILYGE